MAWNRSGMEKEKPSKGLRRRRTLLLMAGLLMLALVPLVVLKFLSSQHRQDDVAADSCGGEVRTPSFNQIAMRELQKDTLIWGAVQDMCRRLAREKDRNNGRTQITNEMVETRFGELGPCPPYDLWEEFSDSNKWHSTMSSFFRNHPGFDQCRYVTASEIRTDDKIARFNGDRLSEARIRFSRSGVSDIYISLFNKGDEKCLKMQEYAKRVVDKCQAAFRVLSPKGPLIDKEDVGENKWIEYYTWKEGRPKIVLSCGFVRDSRFDRIKVEYVNVHMAKHANSFSETPLRDPKTRVVCQDGDVYLRDVPMVDQGPKGYCVPATLERELRYFGIHGDMHELALALGTKYQGGGGTPVDEMVSGLSYADEYAKLRRRDCFEYSVANEMVLSWYNMMADDLGANRISIADFAIVSAGDDLTDDAEVPLIDWDALKATMDRRVLEKCREKDVQGREMLLAGVKESIDNGLPLIWGINRSMFSEERYFSGGHMRMIVGYNETKEEILYSDSWGMGHERKRALIRHAISVTQFCTSLVPDFVGQNEEGKE